MRCPSGRRASPPRGDRAMVKRLTGVILAGGVSQRMGQEKACLPWGDATLLEHCIDTLRPAVDEIIVAVSDAQRFDLRNVQVVEDLIPGAHALGGLYTGLRAASSGWCFVCACDMPFVNPRLVRALAVQAHGYDAVIPKTTQGLQPLHAVYATSALGAMEAQLRRRQWDLHALVTQVRAKILEPDAIHVFDPEERSFLNLNSPEDYRRALECGTKSWRWEDEGEQIGKSGGG